MRDMIELDRLWIVILVGIITTGLLFQSIITIYVLFVDRSEEILPFIFLISITVLQGGAIGYLLAFYILSRKFIKYDRLIVKNKRGFDYFIRKPNQDFKILIQNKN